MEIVLRPNDIANDRYFFKTDRTDISLEMYRNMPSFTVQYLPHLLEDITFLICDSWKTCAPTFLRVTYRLT